MTTRSIVLGTTALLLLSAAAPVQFGFFPAAAIAQEISAEVRAALAADPSQLEARQISDHVRVLRDAIQSGAFTGADKKAAQEKMRAMREVLKQLRAGRQETAQVTEESEQAEPTQQAEQAEPEESVQGQQPQSKAERQAEKAARRAERQAEKAAREAEKQARQASDSEAEEQAQQPAQQAQQPAQKAQTQAQTQQPAPQAPAAAGPQLSPGMIAALRDNRAGSELEPDELRERIRTLRSIGQLEGLNEDERAEVRARMTADREALQARRNAGQEQAAPEATPETEPRKARVEKMPEAEVEQKAQAIMSDSRPAGDIDDEALRKRLTDNRAILETGQLSKAEIRDLRQQLRQDRQELRARVASTQDQADEDDDASTSSSQSNSQSESVSESQSSAEATANVNVNVVIEERRASDTLSDRDLERRVRALNRALKEERLARRDAEIAMELIQQDRRELRQRLHVERDRRRERRRSGDTVFIEFDAGYRPPQVIFAAEAMPRQIEMQLIAPPARQISRRYSVQEIASNQEVREMMPGIEIDTLNFDFGSAEVRPEEIDKLDAIAEVIERIVAERPDEVFLIEGHTDAVGSDAANAALSQDRSHAVVEALLDYYAIDPENLQPVGLGERFLKVWTEEPEEENRRVTIRRITPLLAGGQG